MRALNSLIIYLWYAVTALQALAVISLLRKRLARSYPVFTVGLALSCLMSAFLIAIWVFRGFADYRHYWAHTRTLDLAIITAWVAEAYVLKARHYRRFGSFGTALAGAIAVGVAIAIGATSGIGAHTWIGSHPTMLVERHWNLACAIFLVVSRAWFARRATDVRRNLRRHVWYLVAMSGGQGISNALAYAAVGYWPRMAGLLLMYGLEIWALVGWLRMTQTGERWTPPPAINEAEARERAQERRRWLAELLWRFRQR